MVAEQIERRGIRDARVLEAFRKVPRHLFVPQHLQSFAYDDRPLVIGYGQTISQPYMVAIMTELLNVEPNMKVLEVGTGSGYQAAILAELGAEVHSIERIPELAQNAQETLEKLGYKNVKIHVGDGSKGLPGEAPFDRIIITAACPKVPPPLIEQLREGGILVAPVGDRWLQQLIRIIKNKNKIETEYHGGCMFVPLVGEHGWRESY